MCKILYKYLNFKGFVSFWHSNNRIRLLLLGLLYCVVYDYVYCNFVNEFFSYDLDTEYSKLSGWLYFSYLMIAALPLVFYKGLKTVASAFSLFVYVLTYIPIINSILSYSLPSEIKNGYCIALFISMCSFFMTDHISMMKFLFTQKSVQIPFRVLEIFTCISVIILCLLNIDQMQFVNFLENKVELYEARADNDIKLVYLMCWIRGAFLPLIMVKYLKNKEIIKYFFSFIAFALIFMLDKQKMTIVFPFVLSAMVYIINKNKQKIKLYFHAIIIIPLLLFSLGIVAYISYTQTTFKTDPVVFGLASLFIVRTMCIEGMEAERYFDFFVVQHNPYTYYGHINVIDALTGIYPYPESIGKMVAGDGGNSNATFWLMDGVAAMGIVGVIIISIIFIIFKSIINSSSIRCSPDIFVCISLLGIMSMMNVSLFTSIVSSGILVLFFICLFFNLKDLQ